MLRDYFNKGTVHVDNSSAGIRRGVEQMQAHFESYETGIRELQVSQQAEWQEKVQALAALVGSV
jgi:hypothetical protein